MLLIARGDHPTTTLVAVATAGNTIGALVSFAMGRYFLRFQDRRWFPASRAQLERAARLFRRYGLAALLFTWIPVVGDALVVGAGLLRVPVLLFLLLAGLGKAVRYGVVAWGAGALLTL